MLAITQHLLVMNHYIVVLNHLSFLLVVSGSSGLVIVDLWPPPLYIPSSLINRDQCPLLEVFHQRARCCVSLVSTEVFKKEMKNLRILRLVFNWEWWLIRRKRSVSTDSSDWQWLKVDMSLLVQWNNTVHDIAENCVTLEQNAVRTCAAVVGPRGSPLEPHDYLAIKIMVVIENGQYGQ